MLADIERKAAGRYQQDADRGNHADPGHGLPDIGLGTGIELAQRAFHIVQVNAGAQHPAPFRHRHHVAKLGRQLLRRRLSPLVAHRTAAGFRRRDQLLDRERALGVAQRPQVLADQLGLTRVHQVAALQVVQEEVAVRAVVEPGQRLHRRLPRGGVVAAGTDHRRDRALRQLYVVAQLGLLALQVGGLDQRALMLRELGRLVAHGKRDAQHGDRQGRHREQQDLLAEFHTGPGVNTDAAQAACHRRFA
ncbi:hypothetical protein D9M69_544900 [compost metagenome]